MYTNMHIFFGKGFAVFETIIFIYLFLHNFSITKNFIILLFFMIFIYIFVFNSLVLLIFVIFRLFLINHYLKILN